MELKQGDLENIILDAVWGLEESSIENIDVANVQTHINSGSNKWAYTTVKTVLDRLVEKAILVRLKTGKSKKYYYRSAISRLEAAQEAVTKVANLYFYGNLESLSVFAQQQTFSNNHSLLSGKFLLKI